MTAPMLVVLSRIPVFERDHHAAQEGIELFLLAVGQRLREQRLLLGLDSHRLLVLHPPVLRQLDEDAPPIRRIAQTADEALLLKRVEPARHGSAREVGATRELAGLAAVWLARPAQCREHVPVTDGEAELIERLVVHPLDAPVDATNAVDDP